VVDILISNGVITKIADTLTDEAEKVIDAPGLCVSIGWMDMRANFRDPGHEYKEDLNSGLRAAARGGFTAVALSPDTYPAVDSKGAIEYALNRTRDAAVEIFPIGALSKGLKGESLAEMYDMFEAGAVAFGDDKRSIATSGLLHRALLYAKNFGAPILHFPYDASLIPGGQMNEGIESTKLGLKGIPSIAEEITVQRDITLLGYTEGRLHLGPVSDARSVELIHAARQSGLSLTCETTAAHLAYSDLSVAGFDSNFKLMPPLRTEENRRLLVQQLAEGKIQVISSDHSPEDEEHKKLEFDYANFGAAAIEVFFPLVYSACANSIPIDQLVAAFSIHPRQVLDINCPAIEVGEVANLTLFTIAESTHVVRPLLQSKAYNIAEIGKELSGRVVAIINQGILAEPNP
jgi:dihydroorotase